MLLSTKNAASSTYPQEKSTPNKFKILYLCVRLKIEPQDNIFLECVAKIGKR